MIKQITKRALLSLVGVMTICFINAQTIVVVGGLEYTLSGAYATVYGVADGNTNNTITIPSTIKYNGLSFEVNALNDACFCNSYKDSYGKNYVVVNGITSQATYSSVSRSDAVRRATNNSYVQKIILPKTISSIGDYSFFNSNITYVKLKEGINTIGDYAFRSANITSIIIPSTLQNFSFSNNIFYSCDMLRTIIYLGSTPPSGWVATSTTYVPDKTAYSKPRYSINNANVVEMISFNETTFSYSGKAPAPSFTNNMEEYSVNLSMNTLKSEVGTYEKNIPATFTNENESFEVHIPYKYTIEKVNLKAKANNTSRIYGEANPDFTISYSGFVNGENESVLTTKPVLTTSANELSSVGTYPISVSGGEANNYTIECKQGELTVNKASLGIQVMNANKVYGSKNPTFTLNYSGLKNDETVPSWSKTPVFTTIATKESGAGTYDVTVTCEPQNYEIISNTPGKLTISKAPLTIKADNVTMDYCGTMPQYSYSYIGFVNNDTEEALSTKPSIATEATANSNAGDYIITPEGAQSNNYDFTYKAGTLTIKQRPLTVKANSASRPYGENNPDFSIEYTGFANDETEIVLDTKPSIRTTATTQSNTGSYDIRVSGGQAKNYTFTYQNGVLTITPRPLKAYVGNYERAYGENNPTFEMLYEGFAGNDTEYSLSTQPIARTSATRTSNVGTYDIEVTGGYSPNYTLSYGSGQLTIMKAEQSFTWNQDLKNLKVGDQVELQANASSNLPITFTMDSNDFAEIYKAGSKTYMECKAPGSFHIKAIQDGNDNYYSTARINKDVTIVGEDEYNPTLYIKQTDNGMVSTKVNKGSKHTFKFYAENGWKIHSVTFNDNDVTNELDSNNSFTTPAINENATLIVVYEQESTAVNKIQNSNVKVLATSEGIKVTGIDADNVIQVYSIEGVLQKSVRAEGSIVEIPLLKNNVYIVKIGTKTIKLRL